MYLSDLLGRDLAEHQYASLGRLDAKDPLGHGREPVFTGFIPGQSVQRAIVLVQNPDDLNSGKLVKAL